MNIRWIFSLNAKLTHDLEGKIMHTAAVQPLIALIAGILILLKPQLLSYIVGIYLIIVGILGLLPFLR